MALMAALRHLATVGDEPQRQSARLIVEGAARTITSILAEGQDPTAAPEAEPDTDGAEEATGTDAHGETDARAATPTRNETETTA